MPELDATKVEGQLWTSLVAATVKVLSNRFTTGLDDSRVRRAAEPFALTTFGRKEYAADMDHASQPTLDSTFGDPLQPTTVQS